MPLDQTQFPLAMDTDPTTGLPMPKSSVTLTGSNVIQPVDVQNHLTQTVTALNAVALTIAGGATPNSISSAITCDGFNEISVNAYSGSSGHAGYFVIQWSYDNTNFYFWETPSGDKVANNMTTNNRYATVPVRAPYCKIYFVNTDATIAPTVTANVYLKA